MQSTHSFTETTLPNGLQICHLCGANTEIVYGEIFRDDIYRKFGITIKDNDCVFDVGANIGMFLLFVHQVCPTATVYSFEPIPETFAVLRENARRHHCDRARLFNCGLSNRAGHTTFTFYPRTATSSTMYPDDSAQAHKESQDFILDKMRHTLLRPVLAITPTAWQYRLAESIRRYYQRAVKVDCQLRTLPDVIDENGVERIDLLKIDAEMAEFDIMGSLRPHDWSKIRQTIIEVHEGADSQQRMNELLQRQGFHVETFQQSPIFPNHYLLYGRRG